MYISYDCDGGSYVHDVALPHQDLLGFLAYLLDESFAQELFVTQSIDAGIEVEWGHPCMSSEMDRCQARTESCAPNGAVSEAHSSDMVFRGIPPANYGSLAPLGSASP